MTSKVRRRRQDQRRFHQRRGLLCFFYARRKIFARLLFMLITFCISASPVAMPTAWTLRRLFWYPLVYRHYVGYSSWRYSNTVLRDGSQSMWSINRQTQNENSILTINQVCI